MAGEKAEVKNIMVRRDLLVISYLIDCLDSRRYVVCNVFGTVTTGNRLSRLLWSSGEHVSNTRCALERVEQSSVQNLSAARPRHVVLCTGFTSSSVISLAPTRTLAARLEFGG